MNNKNLSFYSMVFLALALMGLIIVTQLFTNQSTQALQSGNVQAVETFKINNRMQQLVNVSFDLQSKLTNFSVLADPTRLKGVSDSVTILGYTTYILHRSITKLGYKNYADEIDSLVKQQLDHSLNIIVAVQADNFPKRDSIANLLHTQQLGDKVYSSCLNIQKVLEGNLEETLKKNTEQARILSVYNRVLAIVAIVAILIMATIIIKRQSDQLKLIEELRAAEIAALKSKNAKDDFVANMSHELRTPLNALIGFSNLLQQTNLSGKQKEYVDVIQSGGYNLLNIVNDVLDLSKIEAGKLKIVNRPFSLAQLLQNIEMMFSTAITEKKLSYEWRLDERIPANLKGDSERLRQILINLIGNAIKFTNAGNIRLNTGIVWADEQRQTYKLGFTIKDTGVGIPKEKVQTIFERFEQLEHVTTRQHGGTGLGLTIVKNLVEKMGGAISVYSEVGVGSEFSFTCVFESAGAPSLKSGQTKDAEKISLANFNILAAEDNKANQMLLKHMLNKYDASITMAENGKEVIGLLKNNRYDLVLMDIQMPEMDGYTAIRTIKKEKSFNTPVIAMTAYVSEAEIQKCMQAGFDDYLPKPFEEQALLSVISKYHKGISPTLPVTRRPENELAFLKELVGDDPDAVNEIISEMKEQWSLDKMELETALRDKNEKEIKRILHRVKSTFSPLGPDHEMYLKVSDKNNKFVEGGKAIGSEGLTRLIVKIDEFTNNL